MLAELANMNKRKRVHDHEPRPRASPVDQEKVRLRRSIAEIGEPSRTKVDEVLREVADAIVAAHEEVRPPVLETISAVVFEQPHKIPLLAFLVDLVNRKLPSFSRTVVEMTHTVITNALKFGQYRRLDLFLRFAASISVIDGDNVDELIADLAERANKISHLALGHALFSAAVFAAIHRLNTGASMNERVEKALLAFSPVVDGDSSDNAPFYGENSPYTAEPSIVLLAAAVKNAQSEGWPTDFLLKSAKLLPELTEEDSKEAHRFPAVQVAEAKELVPSRISRHEPLRPPIWTRIYLPKDGIKTVPEPDTIFAQLLRDVAGANINHMDFNRKEVTRQLITLDIFFESTKFAPPGIAFDELASFTDGRSTIKVEDVALEAVLDQMFRLPSPGFPTVYFDTILIEACVMAPQAIAPVLGRALRFLFDNCETLDAEVYFRVVEWFGHHMSNFGFTWKWTEWTDALSLPPLHPKQVFMRELINKQVRLSYSQRVRDVLPTEFVRLVPDIPEVPEFVYANDENVSAFIKAAQESVERGLQAFEKLREAITSDKIGQEASELDKAISSVLVSSICQLGSRSVSHASTWVKQLASLVRDSITDQQLTIDAVMSFWKDQPWAGALVLDRFAIEGLVSSESIVKYVTSHKDLLITTLGWEILGRYDDGLEEAVEQISVDPWWDERLKKALLRRKAAKAQVVQLVAAEAAEVSAPVQPEGKPAAAPQPEQEATSEANEPDEPAESTEKPAKTAEDEAGEDQQEASEPAESNGQTDQPMSESAEDNAPAEENKPAEGNKPAEDN